MKKLFCTLAIIALCSMLLTGVSIPASATSTSSANKNFSFNGSMTEEVLRNYCSRAVSCAGFCVEGLQEDTIFEEDLRMLQRIGAKYIGRAAYYSWSGNMSAANIEQHYASAAAKAALAHEADPEMILQAGVFEIMYKGTVNNTAIPDWVFTAFGLAPENRNFSYDDMLFPSTSKYYIGFWGNDSSAVPCIAKTETQMYFYYMICRYIDCGYEAVHLGQAEMMADYNSSNYQYWDTVTTLARTYATGHARRGVILFDCHIAISCPGMKVGNRLICDIQGAGIVPNETVYEDGAYKCEISDYKQNWLQWIGRSAGGQHPLGFTVENNFTILEFDNYGGSGNDNVPTYEAFYNWGYDDITWFALQPEWYRNQFLTECNAFLTTNDLDSEGNQQYFLQPSCRRCLTETVTMSFTCSDAAHLDFVMEYLDEENTAYTYNTETGVFTLSVAKDYRCNNQSDGCPNGFSQEDTIRSIFLGANAAEDTSVTGYVLPDKYNTTTATKKTVATTVDGAVIDTNSGTDSGVASGNTAQTDESSVNSAEQSNGTTKVNSGTTTKSSDESEAESVDGGTDSTGSPLIGILIGLGIVVLAGAGAGIWFWKFRKK